MLAAGMRTSTRDSAALASSSTIDPSTSAKRPFTVAIIMWRTANSTCVWIGSIDHTVAVGVLVSTALPVSTMGVSSVVVMGFSFDVAVVKLAYTSVLIV